MFKRKVCKTLIGFILLGVVSGVGDSSIVAYGDEVTSPAVLNSTEEELLRDEPIIDEEIQEKLDSNTANSSGITEQEIEIVDSQVIIVELEYVLKDLVFAYPDFILSNRPELTEGFLEQAKSNDYLDVRVQGIAVAKTSDGEEHVNYKLGERYYWTNLKAFNEFPRVVEKVAVSLDLKIENSEYNFFNVPEKTFGAVELIRSELHLSNNIKAVAKYITSDGEAHYNFKLGNRYYWANAKIFVEIPSVVKKEPANQDLKFVSSDFDLYNVPQNTLGAKKLLDAASLLNQYVTGVAIYTTSDGEQHYNFKLGDRYYWANSKAFEKIPTVVKKEPANQDLKFISSDFDLYNVPQNTLGAKKLLDAASLVNQYVTGVAIYTTSDGEQHYNFKHGNRYYWANSKIFEKIPTVIEKSNVNYRIEFTSGQYGLYNVPENTKNSKKISDSSDKLGQQVTAVAVYKTSDGESHYNFKYKDRYYWSNIKNFSRVNHIVKRENVNFMAKFDFGGHKLYNVPYKTSTNIQELGSTQSYINQDVRVVAIFTTDDGEKHYNYKLGDRYYWTNSRAFFKYKTVISMIHINRPVIMKYGGHGLHNVPYGTVGSQTLGYSSSHLGSRLTAVAEAKLDDGTSYYNYKLGDRYYWTNTRAFTPIINGSQVVNAANKYVGIKSYPSRSNMFSKAYWGQGFNGSLSAQYDWCSVFVWYVFRELGSSELFYNGGRSNATFEMKYPERYPETVRQWQISQGNYFTNKNALKAGDLVFFDWKRPIRTSEHVGIFVGFDRAGNMMLIDGNWGDMVLRRTLYPGDWTIPGIMGYARPY